MRKALSSLGLKGGGLLADELRTGLGLDELRLETEGDLTEASVVLGKYLSPRLYVRYGVGLAGDAGSFLMRYELTEHLRLESETGEASGADLLYEIER